MRCSAAEHHASAARPCVNQLRSELAASSVGSLSPPKRRGEGATDFAARLCINFTGTRSSDIVCRVTGITRQDVGITQPTCCWLAGGSSPI